MKIKMQKYQVHLLGKFFVDLTMAKLTRQFELNKNLDLSRNNEEIIDKEENEAEIEKELEFSEVIL